MCQKCAPKRIVTRTILSLPAYNEEMESLEALRASVPQPMDLPDYGMVPLKTDQTTQTDPPALPSQTEPPPLPTAREVICL